MDPLGWIKTHLIVILAAALAASVLVGGIGTFWYKNKFEKADLAAKLSAAQLQTCATVNEQFGKSVEKQNAEVKGLIARMEAATKAQEEAAKQIMAAARAAAQPARDLGIIIKNFKPAEATAKDPCAPEHSILDEFFSKRGGLR